MPALADEIGDDPVFLALMNPPELASNSPPKATPEELREHRVIAELARCAPGPDVWLLSEWPRDERASTKYYLSSLPATTSLRTLVRFGKLRWRIERDYQELKGELGLDHCEGRTWNGFHHHAALCAAAHAFLALRRALFPPAVDTLDHRRRRRHLQSLLLQRLPRCPLCGQCTSSTHQPRGPSRM